MTDAVRLGLIMQEVTIGWVCTQEGYKIKDGLESYTGLLL